VRRYPPYPSAPEPKLFESFDGQRIAYRELGNGRPTLLIHGILSDGAWAWCGPGHVDRIAALGRRAIIPDLRGHGRSAKPHDAAAYADDALARDQEALLRHLGIAEVDVVGYSLGARTTIRWMVRGARPGRAVLGGIGDTFVVTPGPVSRLERAIRTEGRSGEPADKATWDWLTHGAFDARAMLALLAGQATTSKDELARLDVPVLIVMGSEDHGVGSAEGLAALLPRAEVRIIPGDHVQVIGGSAFSDVVAEFLAR